MEEEAEAGVDRLERKNSSEIVYTVAAAEAAVAVALAPTATDETTEQQARDYERR